MIAFNGCGKHLEHTHILNGQKQKLLSLTPLKNVMLTPFIHKFSSHNLSHHYKIFPIDLFSACRIISTNVLTVNVTALQ